MSGPVTHHRIATNGIAMHIATQGEGPLVILCHGFPGLWYSWRYQLSALAEAGFQAVAMDLRGYGRTDRPLDPAVYDSDTVIADVLGLLDALAAEQAVFIGHDFGAALVYNLAVRHPGRVAAVVGVACPYDFDLAGRGCAGARPPAQASYERGFARPDKKPTQCFADIARHHFYHMHYYQKIGPAEAELGAAPRIFLERLFWALSADGQS